MVLKFLHKGSRSKRKDLHTEGRTFILEDTDQNPRLRRFSGDEEAHHIVVKEWIPEASCEVPVTEDEEPTSEVPVSEVPASEVHVHEPHAPDEQRQEAIDSRVSEAGAYYAAKQYQQRDTVETRDDIHYEVRQGESYHQRTIGNRFTSTDIDPQDTESSDDDDTGVELEHDKYDYEEDSHKATHGFFRNMLAVFRHRSSKRSLDTTQEGSFDDSESEKAPPPEMETVQFINNSLEATSTMSESTDGDSNASDDDDSKASNPDSGEESDDEEEEQEDDLFEDGLFEDGQEYWSDRMMCICSCN